MGSSTLSGDTIYNFQEEILTWFTKNKRDLPWRQTRNPYNILVSEFMLQQTQVTRVIPKYDLWFKKFPTIFSLAKANSRDVLTVWSGLGYNRRALYLQKCVKQIIEKFEGKVPQDEKMLRSLPGIGEYTARALLCFAFNRQIAVVDTNVKKVIALSFFNGKIPNKKILQKYAEKLLPKENAYEWNQALMDYASLVLKNEKISIKKQSKFKDSDRYFRGQIIKILIQKNIISKKGLHNYFIGNNKNLELFRLEKILVSLEKDKFITRKNDMLSMIE